MKHLFTIQLLLLLVTTIAKAQTLTGNLKHHTGQHISLTGFNYYDSYELAKTTIDSLGNFTLNHPKNYKGMGILNTQDANSLVLMLTEPNIVLNGSHLTELDSFQFANSRANTNFISYAKAQGLRSNAMSALKYIDNLYQKEPLFAKRKELKKAIKEEQAYIIKEDAVFVANLDKDSYLRWFIPYKKLVQDMPAIVRKETQRIPEAIQQFRTTDFNHPNFKTSGLFRELIEGHYLLLENMGQSLDSVYAQMNVSTSYLVNNLKEDPPLLKNTSKELFTYFEKRSLFKVAAHLSATLIQDHQDILDDAIRSKMERYVTLKVGNTAPNVQLADGKTLKDINNNILLVFGSAECPHCTEANKKLLAFYPQWQEKGNIEVVYISIDTNKALYTEEYSQYPWQTYCNYKGWDTQAAKDYFVDATPSYFLLDKDLKILMHPRNIEHVNTWVDYRL